MANDVDKTRSLLILLAVVFVGYAAYKAWDNVQEGFTSVANALGDAWQSVKSAATGTAQTVTQAIRPGTYSTSYTTQLPDNYVVPNSGGTDLGQLRAAGWTEDQIGQFIATYDPGASQGVSGVPDTTMVTP